MGERKVKNEGQWVKGKLKTKDDLKEDNRGTHYFVQQTVGERNVKNEGRSEGRQPRTTLFRPTISGPYQVKLTQIMSKHVELV